MNQLKTLPERFGRLYCCSAEGQRTALHEAAHALLRESLPLWGEEHGFVIPDRMPEYTYIGNRKPCLAAHHPQIHFNLSHCEGLAVCLLSDTECGVDAESIRRYRERTALRVCSPEEQAMLRNAENPDLLFTRLWTLKEAYVKAIGIGISYPLREVSFAFQEDRILSSKPEASFAQLLLPDHIISVCVLKEMTENPVINCM